MASASCRMPSRSESVIDSDRLRPLTPEQQQRYSRNMLVPDVGMVGQQRLCASRILLVGAGGLGSPAALYLAAAGVGTVGIVDDDVVDVSNLQRQVLHTTAEVGQWKTDSARQALTALNPTIEIVGYRTRICAGNVREILSDWDVVIDGTDNFSTRYLLNDACVWTQTRLIHGAVYRSNGQVMVIDAEQGPCYRCVHPYPPPSGAVPSCAEGGVLGVLPGIIGTLQATEAIKLVVGGARPLIGRMLTVNAWDAQTGEIEVKKNPRCPVCGEHPTITQFVEIPDACHVTQTQEGPMSSLSSDDLAQRLAGGDDLTVLDVREAHEVAQGMIPGCLWIPLGQVCDRMDELDPRRPTVVVCAGGVRSAKAIDALHDAGYRGELMNLTGGMAQWNGEVA